MKLELDREELTAVVAHVFACHSHGIPYTVAADMSARKKLIELAEECGIDMCWTDFGKKFYGKA